MYEFATHNGARIIINKQYDYPFVKVVVPWEEARLVPFADSHIGGGHHEGTMFSVRDYILEKENTITLLGGDIIQNGNKRVGDMVFKLDMIPKEQKGLAGEFFSPIQDRIAGAISGNHENWSFRDTGNDIMEDIIHRIGGDDMLPKYFGAEIFGAICNEDDSVCYTFYYAHGKTGHKNTALAVNKVRRDMEGWLHFDVLMNAHSHDTSFDFENIFRPEPRKTRVIQDESYVVFTGHYQKRPESYVAVGGMRPKPLGTVAIIFDMRARYKGSITHERLHSR